MTSNLGADIIMERFQKITEQSQDQIYNETRDEILSLMKKTLRPEFLNRIDDILVFNPLTKAHIKLIIDILFEKYVRSVLQRQGMDADLSETAKQYFADKGYDQIFGARPLKRIIQKELINEISTEILKGNLIQGDKIEIDYNNSKLTFKKLAD